MSRIYHRRPRPACPFGFKVRTPRRINRRLSAAILRDDASAFGRARADGIRADLDVPDWI